MTREEAKKAAGVMLAYAEGKVIEYIAPGETQYYEVIESFFNWGNTNYRVKDEPRFRHFKNAEECIREMQKHQPYAWVKSKANNIRFAIHSMDNDMAVIDDFEGEGHIFLEYQELLEDYEFLDGSPFGIKEE